MENRIKVLILNNGSVQFLEKLPTINQGSTNNYLEVYSETPLDKEYIVETFFRRNDGKTSPYLTLNNIKDENNKTKYYQLRMNSEWYTYVPGDLILNLKVSRLVVNPEEDNQLIIDEYKTASTSVYISPMADFYKPAPLTPTNYDILLNKVNNSEIAIADLEDANFVKEIYSGNPSNDTAEIKYKTYDGSEHTVEISLPYEIIDEKILQANPVKSIEATNNDLQFKYKNVSGETTVTLKSNNILKKTELEDFSSDLVSFSHTGAIEEIENQVYFARRAEADAEGNIINETYVNNNTEENITKKGFYSTSEVAGTTTSAGFTEESGAIKFTTKDENNKDGNLTIKPTTGEFSLTGEVEATGSIQDIVLNNKINTFSQPQVFTERIDIKNTDGTYDSIKHMNNNFLISTSNGTNLMDIDHNLDIVKFLGRQIAYWSEMNEILEKPVFVEIRVGDGQGYFEGNYTIPCNARSSFILVEESTYTSYICVADTTSSRVNITSVIPLNDAPQLQNITAEIVRVIKVGDL